MTLCQKELEYTKSKLVATVKEIEKLRRQVEKLKSNEIQPSHKDQQNLRSIFNNAFSSLRGGKQPKHTYKNELGFGQEDEFSLRDNFWEKRKKKITVRTDNISINENLIDDVGGRYIFNFLFLFYLFYFILFLFYFIFFILIYFILFF